MTAFDAATAGRFARRALENVECEYPNLPHHVLASAADVVPARVLHPAFYGSYDWHSSVHMHWLLVRARRVHPALDGRHAIDAVLERHFDAASLAVERAYLDRPHTAAFERTYGWAWLLKLADELARSGDAQARRWAAAMTPLVEAFVARYLDYLPRADYPLRHGLHANSAFGLAFALDHAVFAGAPALARACRDAARRWYADDSDVPAAWEPSGADFLSPALAEADLMRRVLPTPEFADWLTRFLPGLERRTPATLFTPVAVRDRAFRRSCISTGSICRARGTGAASRPRFPRRIRGGRSRARRRASTSWRACPRSTTNTTSARTGSRASRRWR